ncbi:hypothetical protein BLNAU_3475 [Blattamonas nauphoetae]|uniref:Uncharacterized protein n=1 Tax=Blattamonas nauphoetae TaxID=2049346 RepID=A0ABQ9YD33_9EUKA|nr:hypothetical protein BLNAU_3475 [Blattamonas nauphoetae]
MILNTDISFEDQSTIYCSLVALVKAEYPFDDALQDRAVQFLKSIEPRFGDCDYTTKLVTDLVPSSGESHSEFLEGILTLLSSPCSTVVAATLSFLYQITSRSSPAILTNLIKSELFPKVLATVQPHTLPISGDETIIGQLILIIINNITHAHPWSLSNLGITAAVDESTQCEMLFQKVVLPSSQLVTFLISNQLILTRSLFRYHLFLLEKLLSIGPFHLPTLEFVLASPIVMAFSSCLSFVESSEHLENILFTFNESLSKWKRGSAEVAQSAKRMMEALFSEGFEDTLEQKMRNDKGGTYGRNLVEKCHVISKLLGSNVN